MKKDKPKRRTNWDQLKVVSSWGGENRSWEQIGKIEEKRAAWAEEEERRKTAKDNLNAFNAKQSDWYGTCRFCGQKRIGTLEELSAPHNCKERNVAQATDKS